MSKAAYAHEDDFRARKDKDLAAMIAAEVRRTIAADPAMIARALKSQEVREAMRDLYGLRCRPIAP